MLAVENTTTPRRFQLMFSLRRLAATLAVVGLLSSPIGVRQPPPPRAGEFQDTLISNFSVSRANVNNIDMYVGG
jgi:hypothetical protein